jgi:HEAT repeats
VRLFLFLVALKLSFAPLAAHAENPWGPECKSLQECMDFIHAPSTCKIDDSDCKNRERFEPLQQGLQIEFQKFGKAAIPPLLQVLKDGNELEVGRVAEVLWNSDDIGPANYAIIHSAWRRVHGTSIGLLATRYANAEFAKEVMADLRKQPVKGSELANTFSNFREFDDQPPNGVTNAITEHVECADGEACNSNFANFQFEWINSNAMGFDKLKSKMAQALENPNLDRTATITALNFFSPSEFGRTEKEMKGFAIPEVRKFLSSSDDDVKLEAASILTQYGDESGMDVLVRLAEKQNYEKRIEALKSLSSILSKIKPSLPRIKALISDSDWDVRRHAVILLGLSGDATFTEDLVEQISTNDWLVSYSAIAALRRLPDEKARSAIELVAKTYWHPITRDAAKGVLSQKINLAQYPTEEQPAVKLTSAFMSSFQFPLSDSQDMNVTSWCKSRFERDGYRFVPDFITGPEVANEAQDASSSNAELFENSLLKLDIMKGAKKPSRKLGFNGWNFIGTAPSQDDYLMERDVTGRLIVSRDGFPDSVLLDGNIAAIFLWSGQPYFVTGGSGQFGGGDGFLWKLVQQPDETWYSERVMRLTGSPQFQGTDPDSHSPDATIHPIAISQVWIAPDQTIGVLGNAGAMLIKADGTPQWISCPSPSFP